MKLFRSRLALFGTLKPYLAPVQIIIARTILDAYSVTVHVLQCDRVGQSNHLAGLFEDNLLDREVDLIAATNELGHAWYEFQPAVLALSIEGRLDFVRLLDIDPVTRLKSEVTLQRTLLAPDQGADFLEPEQAVQYRAKNDLKEFTGRELAIDDFLKKMADIPAR